MSNTMRLLMKLMFNLVYDRDPIDKKKMEAIEGKGKKGLIKKTFETCKSIASGMGNKKGSDDPRTNAMKKKSKSWPRSSSSSTSSSSSFTQGTKTDNNNHYYYNNEKSKVTPHGCFTVYVGEEKQRFVIKTRYVNHPLFRMLLEEAESEYGFDREGPLALPCDVNLFVKVLDEMESEEIVHYQGCSTFSRTPSYQLLTPSRLVDINQLY